MAQFLAATVNPNRRSHWNYCCSRSWRYGDTHAQSITSFDPPGSTRTRPASINNAGAVTGYYLDSRGIEHGFIRDASGLITSFDPLEIRPETGVSGRISSRRIAGGRNKAGSTASG